MRNGPAKPVTLLKRAYLDLTDADLSGSPNSIGLRLARHQLERLDEAGFAVVNIAGDIDAAIRRASVEGLAQRLARLLVIAKRRAASDELDRIAEAEAFLLDFRYCRRCGCSEHDACEPPCSWAEADLCSACVEAS